MIIGEISVLRDGGDGYCYIYCYLIGCLSLLLTTKNSYLPIFDFQRMSLKVFSGQCLLFIYGPGI